MTDTTEKQRRARRLWITLGALVVVVLVIAASVLVNSGDLPPLLAFLASSTPTATPTGTPTLTLTLTPTTSPASGQQVMPTANSTMIANLTALPNATPISSEQDQFLLNLRDEITNCADYSAARRDQMVQHIDWMRESTLIPPDVAFALTMGGSDVNNALIYGMAIYTSTEWRLLERPATSCLVTIGQTLNDMLRFLGAEPLTIYDEEAQ